MAVDSAARRAREEDNSLGVARDVGEVVHHDRLTPARRALRDRHRGPHARLELVSKFLDETLLVLGQLRIALREHHLALAWHQPQELHRPWKDKGRPSVAEGLAGRGSAPQPQHVDRAWTGPDLAQAVLHRLRCDPL